MNDHKEYKEYFASQTYSSARYQEKREKMLSMYQKTFDPTYSIYNPFYAQAQRDVGLYAGDQWNPDEVQHLKRMRRQAYTHNKVYKTINCIVGWQIQKRLGFEIHPTGGIEDSAGADIFNDVIKTIATENNLYETISRSVKGAAISGIDFLQVGVDYTDDPVNGDIKVYSSPWNSVLLDPWFSCRSLEDCDFIAKRRYLPREKIIAMNPKQADLIHSIPGGPQPDMKFPYLPVVRQAMQTKNLLAYTEYYHASTEMKKHLLNKQTGEMIPVDGDNDSVKSLLSMNPALKLIDRRVKVIQYAVFCQDTLLYYGENPFGINRYPFVPMLALFEPSYPVFHYRIQSLVSIIRDAQIQYNKKRSKMEDILNSQITSGWMYREDMFRDPSLLAQSGQGANIPFKSTADISRDLMKIPAPEIPTSFFNTESMLEKDIMEGLGINPEVFGGDAADPKTEVSATLFKMRQATGLIGLQPFFDGVRETQKVLGEILLEAIQANYSPEKIQTITGKTPPVEFYTKLFRKYRVRVEEGQVEDSQVNLQQLLALQACGVPIPASMIVENTSIYNKDKVLEYVKQQEEQQAQLAQLQIEKERKALESLEINMLSEAAQSQSQAIQSLASAGTQASIREGHISKAQETRAATTAKVVESLQKLSQSDLGTLLTALPLLEEIMNNVKAEVESAKEAHQVEEQELLAAQLPPSQEIMQIMKGNTESSETMSSPINNGEIA